MSVADARMRVLNAFSARRSSVEEDQALDHLEAEVLREYASRVAHIEDVAADLRNQADEIEQES